jgi:hypothetical protein
MIKETLQSLRNDLLHNWTNNWNLEDWISDGSQWMTGRKLSRALWNWAARSRSSWNWAWSLLANDGSLGHNNWLWFRTAWIGKDGMDDGSSNGSLDFDELLDDVGIRSNGEGDDKSNGKESEELHD